MKINSNELRAIENAIPSLPIQNTFQIPSLHDSIPRISTYAKAPTNFGALGMQLLEAGIIDPATVDGNVTHPTEIIFQGLENWFLKRISHLEHIQFDVEFMDAENANTKLKYENWDNLELTGPGIALTGRFCDVRLVKDVALHVEQLVPSFFLTTFNELVAASYRSIDLHHPNLSLERSASYHLWSNDIHSVTDKEAEEELRERFGDEVDVTRYMPDAILEVLGNGFCFDITRNGPQPKRRQYSDLRVKKLAKHSDPIVAGIASQLLALRKAARNFEPHRDLFHHPHEFCTQSFYAGCILMFQGDEREARFMDEDFQELMNYGEGTDVYGVMQLADTVGEIRTQFKKIEAFLNLVTQMDKLISKISYSYD